jgi:alpha,alpha-trehalase
LRAAAPPATNPGARATPLVLSRGQGLELACQVLLELDTDCDRRLTIDDERAHSRTVATAEPTLPRFPYVARAAGVELRMERLHQAAQLVQELVVGLRSNADRFQLLLERVRADPATYLAYRIQQHHWDALTRRIDADPARLLRAAVDEKMGYETKPDVELCPALEQKCPAVRRAIATSGTATESKPTKPRLLHVYYPPTDPQAGAVFANASVPERLLVQALPAQTSAEWFAETTRQGRHGLLSLALAADGSGRPFVVPGGRFNELYGWDSFFIVWGLLQEPERVELARSMVDNQIYEITHYGKILNANRTYYLLRSQPPFLTSAISQLWERLPHTEGTKRWLAGALRAAIREYRSVWNAPPRKLSLCEAGTCLARYFGEGHGEPPEVEAGHFAWFYQRHALAHGHCQAGSDAAGQGKFLSCTQSLAEQYRNGELKDRAIDDFFAHDRCVRESGHDTSFRWWVDGAERCADFASVDLNSLLFKYEIDLASLLDANFDAQLDGETTAALCARAQARAHLIQKYMWDASAGAFFDYDTRRRRRSDYLAATTLYPLWASAPNVCGVSLLTPAMATALRSTALRELEAPGGLLATSAKSLAAIRLPTVLARTGPDTFEESAVGRQWEAPTGWAPHQMLAWVGLTRAGFEADAERLTYRWLYTIVRNAASYHGTVPEKYDVIERSHAVFREYGNVNTDFAYIADEGFGWMNASFMVGWHRLGPKLQHALQQQTPPEQLFPN